MITFNKQLLESLNACAEGIEYAETLFEEKGAEVELGSCTDATVSDRLFIAFGLGITVTDILLFISPYDSIEDFKAAALEPENINLLTRPIWFELYPLVERFPAMDKSARYASKIPVSELNRFFLEYSIDPV